MKRQSFILCLLAGAVTGTCPALVSAQQAPPVAARSALPDTPEAFHISFRAWAEKHAVKDAVLVVHRQGKPVLSDEMGILKATDPQPVASLSKAISAACVATLVRDGKLSFDTPLREALPQFFQKRGEPFDQRVKDITIGQLITHQAGFPGRPDKGASAELISTKVIVPYLSNNTSSEPGIQAMLSLAFKHPLAREPGASFEYGNASYLALAAVIEEKSGLAYEQYCRNSVLKPMGADATLDPKWAALSGFGGWRISGADYLAFMDIMSPQNTVLGQAIKSWNYDDAARPARAGTPVWYGLGVNIRKAGNGYNIWHTGRWRMNLTNARGVFVDNFGSFAIRYASGVSVFIAHRPSLEEPALLEMQRAVTEALQAVKNWN